MSLGRRYAEGWDDGFVLRRTANLLTASTAVISRFLESPIGWTGNPTAEQKRETIDRVKAAGTKELPAFSCDRLRRQPQPRWQEAYSLRGTGSTFKRKMRIESIYERWVPVPNARGHRTMFDFLNEIKAVVTVAVDSVENEVTQAKSTSAERGPAN